MGRGWTVAMWLGWVGCVGGTEPVRMDCEQVAIPGLDGAADPCDVAACQACVDTCGGDCLILESFPPQYSCGADGSFTVYDECPDWEMPEALDCDDADAVVAADEVTPLGFSADDVLAAAAGPFVADAEWVAEEGRPATTVSLSVVAAGDPVFHDRSPAGGGSIATSASFACPDTLELPVSLSFSSGDGAFAETVATTMTVIELGALSVSAPLDWTALGGTFTFVTIDAGAWDLLSLDLETTLTPALAGQVQVSATKDVGPSTGNGFAGPLLRWPPMD